MSYVIRWTRDRWFLLGLAFLVLNTWAVVRWTEEPSPMPLPARAVSPPPARPALPPPVVEPLKLLSVHQVEFRAGESCTLRLTFNAPPQRANLESFIEVRRKSDNRVVPFTILGEVASDGVLIRRRSVRTDRYLVKVRAGLRSVEGSQVFAQDVVRDFKCATGFELRRIEPQMPALSTPSVRLYFSAPVDTRDIEDLITVHPPVDVSFQHVRGWRESGVAAVGGFQPGTLYTITLDAALTSSLGTPLNRPITRHVHMPDRPSSIELQGSGYYLSAAGRKQLKFDAVNVDTIDLRVKRIYPNNLVYFATLWSGNYRSNRRWHRPGAYETLGKVVGEQRLEVTAPVNTVRDVTVALESFMGEQTTGAFLVDANPDRGAAIHQLVIVTDIGLTVKRTPRGLLVWANSIRSAQPLPEVTVSVYSRANQLLHQGQTDDSGLVQFPAAAEGAEEDVPYVATAHLGDDLCYLPLQNRSVSVYGDTRGLPWPRGDLEAYLYTDRGVYRPGETTHLRAMVRDRALGCPEPFPVQLKVRAPDGKVSRTLSGLLGAFGTAHFEWTWPSHVPTGHHQLELVVPGSDTPLGSARVAVEEFVPPRIAASILKGPERIRPEDKLHVEIEARYLTGRPAAGRKAELRVTFQASDFAPEGWEGYVFRDEGKKFRPKVHLMGRADLDEDGRAVFENLVKNDMRPPSAIRAALTAVVRDVGGRTTAAYSERMIDVYPHYIGLRKPGDGRRPGIGKPYQIEVAVVRPDGSLVDSARSLNTTVVRITWATVLKRDANRGYTYCSEERLVPVSDGRLEVANGRAAYALVPATPGRYRVTVTDEESKSSSSITVYAAEPGALWRDWSMERPDRIDLELDAEKYQPGEEARLTLNAPFAGRGLLTIETDDIVESRVIEIPAGRSEVTLNPSTNWLPHAYCTLSVIRPLQVGEEVSPHRAVGAAPIPMHEPERELAVRLEAPASTRPGEPLRVEVFTQGPASEPGEVEVVVAAVDEGICNLTGFKTPNPLSLFRGRRSLSSQHHDLYSALMPEFEDTVRGTTSAAGGGGPGTSLSRHLSPVRARRFRPVALWSGPVVTDASGHATVTFDVPEFTGQLRLMAVAAGRRSLGWADAEVKVKRPVQVYTGLPRFLAPGDASRMDLTLINGDAGQRNLSWEIACQGPVQVQPRAGSVSLDAGREKSVSLNLTAGAQAGVARLVLTVTSGSESFQEVTELPVRPPAGRQVLSDVEKVPSGSMKEVRLPSEWIAGTETYQLMLSGFPELKLGRSLDYLLKYPYGCVEQTTSAAFPLLYLGDLADAIRPGTITHEDTAAYIREGILRLLSMQQNQGGFGYWPRTRDIYPWGSIYATHFMVEAQSAGHEVPDDRLAAALRYLETMLKATAPSSDDTKFASDRLRRAYACHVLALAGRPHHGWMGRLLEETGELGTAASACLASALAAGDRPAEAGKLLDALTPGLDADAPRQISACLSSPVRDMGLLLGAWVQHDPTHGKTLSLASRLQELEADDQWRTTHERAVALMALGKFAQQTAERRLPFEGEVSWGGGSICRNVSDTTTWKAQPTELVGGPVRVVNYGPGDAYLYWRAEGVPSQGLPPEFDRQVRIRRTILDRNGKPMLSGPVEQGQLLYVRLTIDPMGQSLDQLVIEDLLPAGLEPENAALKTSEVTPWSRRPTSTPMRHQEARDDRALFFSGPIRREVSVHHVVRAVTPGTYVWPPASVSCMYEPRIRSVHGAATLEVVE